MAHLNSIMEDIVSSSELTPPPPPPPVVWWMLYTGKFLTSLRDVVQVESLWELKVELDGGTLVGATKSIHYHYVNLNKRKKRISREMAREGERESEWEIWKCGNVSLILHIGHPIFFDIQWEKSGRKSRKTLSTRLWKSSFPHHSPRWKIYHPQNY